MKIIDISEIEQKYIALFNSSSGVSKLYIESSEEEAISRAKNECGFKDQIITAVVYKTRDYHPDLEDFVMDVIFERVITPEDYERNLGIALGHPLR